MNPTSGEKMTQPGATQGDPEDSSNFNSQTHHQIKEIDIEVDGGFVSNLSYSSNLFLPKISKKGKIPKMSLISPVSPTHEKNNDYSDSHITGGLPTLVSGKQGTHLTRNL